MSKVIADTIEHSTAGSLTTDYVVKGSAKAWVIHNQSVTDDSFNISSNVDEGTGKFQSNLTNSMSSDLYVTVCSYGMTRSRAHTNNLTAAHSFPQTSSIIRYTSSQTHANVYSDGAADLSQYLAMGDLA